MLSHSPTTEIFEFRFEPTHRAASDVRNKLRDHLAVSGVDRRLRADMELAASELLANAVDQKPTGPVEILLVIDAGMLHLTVTNTGSSGTVALGSQPSSAGDGTEVQLQERGWGLTIVHSVVDGMWVHGSSSSTSVSCLRRRHPTR